MTLRSRLMCSTTWASEVSWEPFLTFFFPSCVQSISTWCWPYLTCVHFWYNHLYHPGPNPSLALSWAMGIALYLTSFLLLSWYWFLHLTRVALVNGKPHLPSGYYLPPVMKIKSKLNMVRLMLVSPTTSPTTSTVPFPTALRAASQQLAPSAGINWAPWGNNSVRCWPHPERVEYLSEVGVGQAYIAMGWTGSVSAFSRCEEDTLEEKNCSVLENKGGCDKVDLKIEG